MLEALPRRHLQMSRIKLQIVARRIRPQKVIRGHRYLPRYNAGWQSGRPSNQGRIAARSLSRYDQAGSAREYLVGTQVNVTAKKLNPSFSFTK